MEEYELNYDDSCPKCGHSPLHFRDCTNLCEDGWFDESDEWYESEGSILEKCPECKGTGTEQWCPKCGTNLSGYNFEKDEPHIKFDDPDQLKLF